MLEKEKTTILFIFIKIHFLLYSDSLIIKIEMKFVWQILNPPGNGASQGNYFLPKTPPNLYPTGLHDTAAVY